MKSCKVLMPSGSLGAGINQESFDRGMAMKPDVIAADAGSTDSGPASLALGECKYSREMLEHDLGICVRAAMKAGIPFLVGSCGTSGTDSTLNKCAEIVEEVFKKEGFKGRIAKVYSQQDPEVLKKKWDEGKIHPLEGAPEITKEVFDECTNIVALMGAEPFIEALNNSANIVLCGRSTDTAIMAAVPLMKGCDVAAAWHAAKTAECGSQCTDGAGGDGVMIEVTEECFYVTPIQEGIHCTPYTVSAHLLYENSDPFRLTEPSGSILAKDAVYTQVDDYTVKVTGTKFEHAKQYTMKLEGASIAGYQNISLVGIADKKVMADPDTWMKNLSEYVVNYLNKMGISPDEYTFDFKAYGYNAVINGPRAEDTPPPREIGLLLTVTSDTQENATKIAKFFNPYLLHFPADFKDQLPSFAFPFSPVDIPKGPTYEFRLNHVVDVDDPLELVRFEYVDM
ncbi:MAG TPA: acyclic terpene utilization AtuA family protein [Anaerovoracaceae bacterium]|nr:acyclic terpene utilization AtuA family protein [Anaerovoracaceae bacterium]